jgi:hypothetical protein
MSWPARIDAANDFHVARLAKLLEREFERLAASIDVSKIGKAPAATIVARNTAALRQHQSRVNILLATQKRATAATFGFMALEMAAPRKDEVKADIPQNSEVPTRAQRLAAVLRELARIVAVGAQIEAVAKRLARNPALLVAAETLMLANPEATASAIAAQLVESPRVVALLTQAHAEATGAAEAVRAVETPASGSGGARKPPPPAPPPTGGGGPRQPPKPARVIGAASGRRSRYSQLVERLVREQAPVRARRIASTSGRVIARVLGQAAAEGLGEDATAKRLVEALGGDVARYRARTIARTELGGAQNAATWAIARDREAAGESLEKGWLTNRDGRERSTHHDCHDQRRPIEEPFDVGGAKLQHPHDPNGQLKEIINCRCGMLIRRRLAYTPSATATAP